MFHFFDRGRQTTKQRRTTLALASIYVSSKSFQVIVFIPSHCSIMAVLWSHAGHLWGSSYYVWNAVFRRNFTLDQT